MMLNRDFGRFWFLVFNENVIQNLNKNYVIFYNKNSLNENIYRIPCYVEEAEDLLLNELSNFCGTMYYGKTSTQILNEFLFIRTEHPENNLLQNLNLYLENYQAKLCQSLTEFLDLAKQDFLVDKTTLDGFVVYTFQDIKKDIIHKSNFVISRITYDNKKYWNQPPVEFNTKTLKIKPVGRNSVQTINKKHTLVFDTVDGVLNEIEQNPKFRVCVGNTNYTYPAFKHYTPFGLFVGVVELTK